MTTLSLLDTGEDRRVFYRLASKAAALKPFAESREARHLILVFAIVYFAQGMYYLPNLSVTFLLKDSFGFSAAETALFFSFATMPWLIKPLYGLISDFFPLFGRRRKSYFMLASGLAASLGFFVALSGSYSVESLAICMMLMGVGFAFNDVLTDALMVENGHRLKLTGPFQAVQWACIALASVLVGIGGGWLAEHQPASVSFLIVAIFPLIALTMVFFLVREPRVAPGTQQYRGTWTAIRGAVRSRTLWIVAGFIFFHNFSPSFGTALTYYATDELHFSKTFLGVLDSVSSASAIVGAILYFAFCRTVPFKRLIHFAIGAGVISTLGYLFFRGEMSALALALGFGAVGMIINLTILDLAARSCPKQAEGTFFALLMSVSNGGVQLSQVTGGWLYDQIGLTQLILVSAGFTALCWFLVPLLKVDGQTSEKANNAGHGEAVVPSPVPA
jgi:MFS family permease